MLFRLKFYIKKTISSLWFRPAAYACLSLLVLAAPPLIEPFVPWAWTDFISANTNQTVLSILASSLLAVAIFSLSAMVSALRAASDSATPRARPLLVGDAAAQNAISTFIGAFLFSLLALMGTLLGAFSPVGRVVLFVVTLVLVFIVVATLIRWLQRLSILGDVAEAIRRVEQETSKALDCTAPPQAATAQDPPEFENSAAVFPEKPGYVQAIEVEALKEICKRRRLRLRICAPNGDFVDAHAPLVRLDTVVDADAAAEIRLAFTLGDQRLFDNDPRLGLIVLSEIASKALSPGINDPGTAIGAVRAAQRVLDRWGRRDEAEEAAEEVSEEAADGRVIVPLLSAKEAFSCAFGPVAFDGAHRPEVASTLLSAYAGLRDTRPSAFGEPAQDMAVDLVARAQTAMSHKGDIEDLHAKARRLNFTAASRES
ncbi:MAG: DUF2254 domain-containing protein [Oceanicaulis sp.]